RGRGCPDPARDPALRLHTPRCRRAPCPGAAVWLPDRKLHQYSDRRVACGAVDVGPRCHLFRNALRGTCRRRLAGDRDRDQCRRRVDLWLDVHLSACQEPIVGRGPCCRRLRHRGVPPVGRSGAGHRIALPVLVPALSAAFVALLLSRAYAAPLAYIGGSLGTLIGADLLNLDKLQGLGAPIASIGGAGTFDGVFLTGVVAVLIASLSRPRREAVALPEPHATKLQ